MHKRLYNFLELNQIWIKKNNSTVFALMEMTEHIRNSIDNGKFGCGIFIDLKKAFDTVNHKILLSKLEHYGVRGASLDWFESYLSGRHQYVVFENESSSLKTITTGVPQGSVLGPLLFLLYINDLPNISSKLLFFLFADDTNIYFESDSLLKLENCINQELKQLSLWLNINRLALNLSKTNFVIFHSNNKTLNHNVTLKLNNCAITQSDCIKYLGVYVDQHLNWKQHISVLSKKISRSIGLMYKLRPFVNINVLKNVYNSLIYSHIVYGIQVWGSACDSVLRQILTLQKKAVRMLTSNDNYPITPGPLPATNPLFKELRILKVKDVFKLHFANFIYRTLSQETPINFLEWFTPTHFIHNYNTRSNRLINRENIVDLGTVSDLLTLHHNRSNLVNYGGNMFRVSGPVLWNSLPVQIRNSQSFNVFKINLKNYFLEQYI